VRPRGYVHAAAFDELIDTLAAAFATLGVPVEIVHGEPLSDGIVSFVFGAHLLPPEAALPRSSVIMNFEQFQSGIFARRPHYIELLRTHRVLDYSARNVAWIRAQTGNPRVLQLKIGAVPARASIPPVAAQDIDVLFYSSINARRQAILDGIAAAGLHVEAVTGVYGEESDRLIARAKLVLNVHYYDDKIHELVRTSHLLANRKAVVSECDEDTEIDDDVREALVAVPYERLVATCIDLAKDDARRRAVEQHGFDTFLRRDQTQFLAEVLPLLSSPD